MHTLLRGVVLAAALTSGAVAATPCSDAARAASWHEPVVEGHADLDALTRRLARHRVVYVGEVHDRLEHHLTQLEIICRLREHGPVAIGAEFFQAPAQDALDAFVTGRGDLQRLLRDSGWFTRWGYDPRLYAPILRFARQHGIRIVALNVPGDIVRKVARGGAADLAPAERVRLPASVQRGPPGYVDRIRRSFDEHPAMGMSFENFLSAQLLWDEGMAQRGAEFLLEHPRTTLVVLAGEEHVRNGDGIPDRLARRVPVSHAIVVQSGAPVERVRDMHVRVTTQPLELPPAGRLGVQLAPGDGGVTVGGFAADSPARDAGIAAGDRLLAVDGRALTDPAQVRLALWNKAPGDAVTVTARRGDTSSTVMVTLR